MKTSIIKHKIKVIERLRSSKNVHIGIKCMIRGIWLTYKLKFLVYFTKSLTFQVPNGYVKNNVV